MKSAARPGSGLLTRSLIASAISDGVARGLVADFGEQRPLDIVVHSLANGPEVKKPLLETSRNGYLTAVSVSAYSLVGTRGDCDLMVRATARSIEPIHDQRPAQPPGAGLRRPPLSPQAGAVSCPAPAGR